MGKPKKNEIDALLEQLKKSYASDPDLEDLADEMTSSERSEDDIELNSILEQIFSSNDKDDSPTVNTNTDDNTDIKTESERVDEVLQIMFGSNIKNSDSDDRDNDTEASDDNIEEKDNVSQPEHKIPPETEADATPDIELEAKPEIKPESETASEYEFVSGIEAETEIKAETETEIEIKTVPETVVVEKTSNTVDTVKNIIFDDFDEVADELLYDEVVEESSKDNDAHSSIITEPTGYVYDQLQQSLTELPFFKPEEDIDFSFPAVIEDESTKDTEENNKKIESTSEMTDKDISLLLKFGYESEISESGEKGHANKVIYENSKKYVPERHKIVHGFTGKEYCEKSQTADIRKKYKGDRLALLIRAILVSMAAISSIVFDLFLPFIDLTLDAILFQNIILPIIVIIILYKRIISGLVSTMRFDANSYSLPTIILLYAVLFNTIAFFCILFADETTIYTYFGGYALLYMSLTIWGEWIDCSREMQVFEFISNKKTHYVADENVSRTTDGEYGIRLSNRGVSNKYFIRRSEFVCGYHRKTTESEFNKFNTVAVLGALPIAAIILGIAGVVVNKSIISGVNIAASMLFLSLPMASVLFASLLEYVMHLKLKSINSACISIGKYAQMCSASSVILEDTDVLEIVGCNEMNSDKSPSNYKKWLNISHSVFKSLGGPIADAMPVKSESESNISHDIAINSIADNGIDMYFDSSMNILIGDRQYMLSHNIKVKIDVNLTGATKGADRSVIYLAFDRIPRIGFILNSKLRESFTESLNIFKEASINIEVRSYEPEINESFFEQNHIEQNITLLKPKHFENIGPSVVSDSNIVSDSVPNMCRAITYSADASRNYSKYNKIKQYSIICGTVIACILSAVQFIPALANIRWIIPYLFYATPIILTIPHIIHTITISKRK